MSRRGPACPSIRSSWPTQQPLAKPWAAGAQLILNRIADDLVPSPGAADNVCAGGVCGGTKSCSFSPNTLVLLADGTRRAIAKVRVGDLVAWRNEFPPRYSARPVTHVYSSWHEDKVTLDLVDARGASERLTTTFEHPFWVAGRGFVPAAQLQPEMRIAAHHGAQTPITSSPLAFTLPAA